MNRDDLLAEIKRHVVVVVHIPQKFQTVCECGEWRSVGFELLAKAYDAHLNHVLDAVLPLIEADVRERIATEIEAIADPLKDNGSKADRYQRIGMQAAARIARGADR